MAKLPTRRETPPVIAAQQHAVALRDAVDEDHKKVWGQYFTPEPLARFAAGMVDACGLSGRVRILDPGAGTGILGLCLAERLLREQPTCRVHLTAVEHEPRVAASLPGIFDAARRKLGSRFSVELIRADFLSLGVGLEPFDVVIANPPYFKLSPKQPRGGDAPNAYARFMDVAATLLRPGGRLCFIIPRSFASGSYFRRFRARFHAMMQLDHVHVFESRRAAFRSDDVLQETIVAHYVKQAPRSDQRVRISSSSGLHDLESPEWFEISRDAIVETEGEAILRLPTSPTQVEILAQFRRMPDTLHSLGLHVSTGPVVPFRALGHLRRRVSSATLPMLWMQHVRANAIEWPLRTGFRKPEHIHRDAGDALLLDNRNVVLLRRFSSKDDRRRITAAPWLADTCPVPALGLENHLNYIRAIEGELSDVQARGIAAFSNSSGVDAYVRAVSGNTQVSATELRSLPFPPMRVLERLGRAMAKGAAIDSIDAQIREHLARA